jgi:hypothetical protein
MLGESLGDNPMQLTINLEAHELAFIASAMAPGQTLEAYAVDALLAASEVMVIRRMAELKATDSPEAIAELAQLEDQLSAMYGLGLPSLQA